MKTNLSAFTILEVLINIVIMSIIIGMVYFVYSSFSKQISLYRMDVEEEQALSSFYLRLKTDFFQTDKIIGSAKSFEAIMYDNTKVFYKVEKGYLYRIQNGNRDSLKIKKLDVSSKPHPVTHENMIEKVRLTTMLFEEPMELTVAKKYPSVLEYKTDYGN